MKISLIAGSVLLIASTALAQQPPVALTLEDALTRARESSPAIVAARLRVDEARGRAVGSSLALQTNPSIDVAAGERTGDTSSTDYEIAAGQELEFPQRRRARIDAANAGVAKEEARLRDTEREILARIATAFLRALEARERGDAAASSKDLAREALTIAERRFAAGDVARLDVNLARTAVARSDAELASAAATLTGRLTELQVVLGIAAPIEVSGSLHDALPAAEADLGARAANRPDLLILDAEIAEAEADARLARALRWPDFGLRASYAEEEGDRIVLGGVGFTLPLFNRGQGESAIASARLARLRAEREALARAAEAGVRGALATSGALRDAAAAYERTLMPLIEENETLALESYEVGQIGLSDLLVVRREALDARRSLIDQLIDARLAEVELRTLAGVWK
ncbi:MAG: TolC family protein [Thermoanaerobaculia bacterium]